MMTIKTRKRAKSMGRGAATWPVAEAKARMSELIDRALALGPQVITRNGNEVVVVVSVDEWRRKTKRKGNLAEFFASSPLRGAQITFERTTDAPELLDL